jgi:enoyl-CoA hydratase/carnithine racemase
VTEVRIHEHLVEEWRGPVAWLRIDREEALGALSRSVVTRLGAYLEELRSDDDVRVLVLTGTGKGFIAGADIAEYDRVSQAAFDDYQRLSRRVFTALEQLPQFTIAAVNGYALGGGFELALCCDMILASERAKFGLPEVKLGLLPGGGGTQRLARAAGIRFTKEAVVTGAFYSAQQMLERGVVSRVCAPGDLEETARATAEAVAANAPLAVRAAKLLVDQGVQMPLDVGLAVEQQTLSGLYASRDGAEGIAAFLEKRDPGFTGE